MRRQSWERWFASAWLRDGPGGWEQLGCRKVGFLVDKDVIHVGRSEGKFRSIRLLVSGNKVHMMDLKVIYANGAARRHPRA